MVGVEVPEFKGAMQQCMNVMIPKDFAKMVWADFESRGGRDGSGVVVSWIHYVQKRWVREQTAWQDKSHKRHPQFKDSNNSKPSLNNESKFANAF